MAWAIPKNSKVGASGFVELGALGLRVFFYRVWGFGFRVFIAFGALGLGCYWVWGFGFRVLLGWGLWVYGVYWVWGFGFRVFIGFGVLGLRCY